MRQRQRDGETISFTECGCVMRAGCKLLAMNILRALAVLALVCGVNMLLPGEVSAQEINFDQIDRFESLGTGTLRAKGDLRKKKIALSDVGQARRDWARRACTLRMRQPLICGVPMKPNDRPPNAKRRQSFPVRKCVILLERCA
jgi:hypothetical protein